MRRVAIVLALLVCGVSAPDARGIVGGSDAPAGKFPYVANVAIDGGIVGASCTGTLVAPTWVVTAGHCVSVTGGGNVPLPITFPPSAFTVTLGTENTDGTGGEVRQVRAVYVDPNYVVTNGTGSDVGLLELVEPSTVTPVQIAAPGEKEIWEPGDLQTIAGFGVTTSDGSQPDRLQSVEVPIVSDADCAKAYSNRTPVVGDAFDPETAVCAGFPEGGKDSCQGDSGGPMLAPLQDGFRLVGATSYGNGCGEPGFPGVYARLAEGTVKDFIESKVPDAYATEAEPPAPSVPTPAPAAPAGSCAGKRVYRLQASPKLKRLTVRARGRKLAARGTKRVRKVNLRPVLRRGRDTKVRVVAVARGGRKQVTVLTFAGCKVKPYESVSKTP